MGELEARLRVASAAAAREAVDQARVFAATAATAGPADHLRAARELRLATVAVVDLSVLLMLVRGASWDEVTRALGRGDEGTVRAYYDPLLRAWGSGDPHAGVTVLDRTAPFRADTDPLTTAHLLDQWLARTAEPFDPPRAQDGLAAALL